MDMQRVTCSRPSLCQMQCTSSDMDMVWRNITYNVRCEHVEIQPLKLGHHFDEHLHIMRFRKVVSEVVTPIVI